MDIGVQRLLNVPRRIARADLWGWALIGLAFTQFLLLLTIRDVISSTAFAIYWMYPIGIAGAGVLTMYGALKQPVKKHRYAWMLQVVSCVFGVIRVSMSLSYAQRGQVFDNLPSLFLYVGMYAGSLGAVAVYLPRRAWWLGNIPRVLMDSAVIGVSVLVMLASLLPFIGKFWYINRTLDLVTIGANITMLFAVFIVSVRYRRNGRSLLNFGVLSIICLMVGDSTSVLSHIILGIAPWRGAVYPLYILHYSLLAMGIYRSIDDPPIPPDPSETVMPRLQWLLWLIIPQVFMICVACVAYIINAAPFWVMIVMASFGIAHSVFLAIDLYRVQTQVYQSNERERKARELIRAIQHELKGHTSALTGLVTLMKQLSGQDENKANEVLSIISGSVHELHDLTHKLLILSHEDVNRVVHLREVQLYDLVHSSTELLYANSLDYPINVIVDVPQDVTLQADPLYLSLTIRTALRNSLQAIRQLPAQGAAHISVRTEIVNDYVCLLVEDNGPGFASDILVKLRSSRDVNGKLLPGVSSSIGGYGLGIALIDQVARIHGGSFDFGNCDSGGAWLRIEIPLKPAMS